MKLCYIKHIHHGLELVTTVMHGLFGESKYGAFKQGHFYCDANHRPICSSIYSDFKVKNILRARGKNKMIALDLNAESFFPHERMFEILSWLTVALLLRCKYVLQDGTK